MSSGDFEQIHDNYESGRWFIARAACWKALESHGADREVIREIALIALRSGDPRTAVDLVSKALVSRPNDADLHNILGNAHRKLGALAEAAHCFRRAAELLPDSAEAQNNLGVCLLELGKPDDARKCFQKVLELNDRLPAALYNLGNLEQLQGQLAHAIQYYQQALSDRPDYVEAHTNLGTVLLQLRRYEESIWHLRRALELRPENTEALNNLGVVYSEQKELESAVHCFQAALNLDANYWEARVNLGDALADQGLHVSAAEQYITALQSHPELHDVRNKLGFILQRCGQFREAEECFRILVDQLSGIPAPVSNLGVALQLQGKTAEAMVCFESAVKLSGKSSESLINLASALRDQGKWDRSLEYYEQALQSGANLDQAHLGIADALCDLRRLEEARHHYDEACRLIPDDADIRVHRAMALLRMGDFVNGWKEFEWRWRSSQFRPYRTTLPRWQGERLEGQTILVHAEQGLGDTLQFVRYLSNLQQAGAEVRFACPEDLLQLLRATAGASQSFAINSQAPNCDWFVPLLSLPMIFKTTSDTIPADIPYVFPEPSRIEYWKDRLNEYRGLRIGICWQGNPQYIRDRWRSIPRSHFEGLNQLPDVHIFSLQKEKGTKNSQQDGGIWSHNLDLHTEMESLSLLETAAAMRALDVVITCDTSLAHLAGAMGIPVWVALDFAADWRWLLDREDTPWYPTMRLFRQSQPGDWKDVFDRIQSAISEFVK